MFILFIVYLLCLSFIRLAYLQCESLLFRSPHLSSAVCLSRQLRELRAKFHHPYKKPGSESKNMTSDFAPEVAK